MFVSRGHVWFIFFFKIVPKFPNSSSVSSSPKLKFPTMFNSACQLTGNTTTLPVGSPRAWAASSKTFLSSSQSLLKWKPIWKAPLADPVNCEMACFTATGDPNHRNFGTRQGMASECVLEPWFLPSQSGIQSGITRSHGIWITCISASCYYYYYFASLLLLDSFRDSPASVSLCLALSLNTGIPPFVGTTGNCMIKWSVRPVQAETVVWAICCSRLGPGMH